MLDTNTGSNQSENGVKASLNFMRAIENNDVNELNNMLESGNLSKMTLYAGLTKALQIYRPNSDSIDIILALLNSRDIDSNYVINTKIQKDQIDPKDKVTILMYACLKGDLQLVDIIIKNHASVNMKDVNNRNALFYAINADKGDNADIVYALINAGINVNEPEKEGSMTGNTPLTLATQKNMRNTVKALLDNNADPDWVVSKDGNTALHFAVKHSNIDIIDKLLNKNASLRVINKDNLTPLSLALKISNTDIYKLLCEVHNKIVQKENETASQILKDESTNLANKELSNYSSYQNTNLTPNNGKNKKKKIRENEESVERKNRGQEKSISLNNNEEENQIELKTNQKGNVKDGKSEAQHNKNNLKFNNSNPSEENNTQTFDTTNIHSMNQSNSGFEGVGHQYYRKRNPKLDLINKMKELKLNNNRIKTQTNPNMHNNIQKSITNSASSFGLQIPIEFSKKIGDSSQSYQFNSYIKVQATPTLYLDLSNKNREDAAILSCQVDDLNHLLNEKLKEMKILQDNIKFLNEENMRLKNDNAGFAEILANKDKYIKEMHHEMKIKEEQFIGKIADLTNKFEMSINHNNDMSMRYEKLEKEFLEVNSKNNLLMQNSSDSFRLRGKDQLLSKKDILDLKFYSYKYDDKYIIKNLQKDILDFQELTKEQIRRNKTVVDEIFRLIQTSVNEAIPEYEVKLFGSHATGLCLNWSDLDLVLVNKRSNFSANYNILHTLYLKLMNMPWKKSIKFVDSTYVPVIKIYFTEEYNEMQMDITLQDGKHFGIKCVELVKSFMAEYEALEPLIFALKNLLKNANLNDPYHGGLSSYGLILMVVSFLQSQLEGNKSIKIADNNIGRLFLEFLCYYGLVFDHTKYVIYTYPPVDFNYLDKDNSNLFVVNIIFLTLEFAKWSRVDYR